MELPLKIDFAGDVNDISEVLKPKSADIWETSSREYQALHPIRWPDKAV